MLLVRILIHVASGRQELQAIWVPARRHLRLASAPVLGRPGNNHLRPPERNTYNTVSQAGCWCPSSPALPFVTATGTLGYTDAFFQKACRNLSPPAPPAGWTASLRHPQIQYLYLRWLGGALYLRHDIRGSPPPNTRDKPLGILDRSPEATRKERVCRISYALTQIPHQSPPLLTRHHPARPYGALGAGAWRGPFRREPPCQAGFP